MAGDGGGMAAKGALARSERFELPTLGFEVRCSIQLSYERINVFNHLVSNPDSRALTSHRKRQPKHIFGNSDYQSWLDGATQRKTPPAGHSDAFADAGNRSFQGSQT
jgi:hypothetical protein